MKVGDIDIQVERKDIKNTHLSVFPPNARVHISAPKYLSDYDILSYAISKIDWITKQREKILSQSRQTKREYVSGENHYLFGNRYILNVKEEDCRPSVMLNNINMNMLIRPGYDEDHKKELLRGFYKKQLQKQLTILVNKWLPILEEDNIEWTIRAMKTKWGSCCPEKRKILFNLELARVPLNCIEYVVVHELVHLKERHHDKYFKSLMTQYLQDWQNSKKQLNEFVATYIGI